MATQIKSAQRFCQHCGAVLERKRFGTRLEDFSRFLTRKYCHQSCMSAAMEGVTKIVNAKNGRRQAAKSRRPACEACGAMGRGHVHHIDWEPTNNAQENLITLCPSCHRHIHSPSFKGPHSSRDQVILCLKTKAARKCSKVTATR